MLSTLLNEHDLAGMPMVRVPGVNTGKRDSAVLLGKEAQPLVLASLCGVMRLRLTLATPETGWTLGRLQAALESAEVTRFVRDNVGANVFLGDDWIGSSEVGIS